MALARPQTEVDAANQALSRHLGQPPIGTLTEDNTRARQMRRHFGQVRDALLAEHEWKFATDWLVPAAGPAPTVGPWTKRYPLPDGVITLRRIDGLGADTWSIEQAPSGDVKTLLTDVDAPLCEVTMRVESPRLWEPIFVEVFALKLAAAAAPVILKSSKLAVTLEEIADQKLLLAKRTDAREKANSTVSRDTRWVTVRGTGC